MSIIDALKYSTMISSALLILLCGFWWRFDGRAVFAVWVGVTIIGTFMLYKIFSRKKFKRKGYINYNIIVKAARH